MSDTPPPGYAPYAPYVPPRDHPQATTILVLGILGLVACQICAPFAWVMGNRAQREIDAAQPGTYGGRGQVVAGRICGIVGTVLGILNLLVIGVLLAVIISDPDAFFDAFNS